MQKQNSHWKVEAESQTLHPAYQGSVWVDPATARVLRIEMQATDLPPDFPLNTVETAVDYSSVTIAETPVLLPVHAETLGVSGTAQTAATTTLISAIIMNLKSTSRLVALVTDPLDTAVDLHLFSPIRSIPAITFVGAATVWS